MLWGGGLIPFVLALGLQISVVEESGKQNKVGNVHKKAELDVVVADLTLQPVLLDLVRPNVD